MSAMSSTLPNQHRADVQGFRALAVLLVVFYHAGLPLSGGYVGVDVFFVISGYVIVKLLLRGWQSGSIGLIDFYLRRVRRLLPAASVVALATLLLSLLFTTYDARTQAFETARAGAVFAANLQLMLFRPNSYFASSEQANPMLHTWSLSLEEQIYFVAPLALFIVWTITGRSICTKRISLTIFISFIAVASLLASYSFTYAQAVWPFDDHGHLARGLEASRMIAFYSPFTRVWEFLTGALVATTGWRIRGAGGRVLHAGGAIAIVGAAIGFDSSTAFPGVFAGIPVLGAAAMLVGSDLRVGKHSIFASPLAGWIGDRSYSLYLWHWPLIQFAKATFPEHRWSALVGLALSIPLAMFTFRWIEQPFRYGKGLLSKRPLSGLMLVCCTGAVFLLANTKAIEPTPELQFHEDVTSNCVAESFEAILSETSCIWRFPSATRDALLVGDSQAGHLTESFIAAAHANGLNARVITRTGRFMENPDHDYVAQLVSQSPTIDVVVVGQLTFELHEITAWQPLISAFLERLTEHDRKVIFVHQIQKGGNPLDCAPVRVLFDRRACDVSQQESIDSERYVRELKQRVDDTILRIDGVSGLDPNEWLCESRPCFSRRDDGWLWRDPAHLSRLAARRLTDPLANAISQSLDK